MSSQAAAAPRTLDELMAHACAFEREAVERYTEFADVLETHNNREAAALFRQLATQEARHAEELMRSMGWQQPPAPPPRQQVPLGADLQQAHYLMHPWHALQVALEAEHEAHDFFAALVARSDSEEVRRAALRLQAEEREHIALLQGWLAKVPEPPPDWDQDPDPPRYLD
ncbi:MAG TPA: ferritin family protein [Ramlibacter sp.]